MNAPFLFYNHFSWTLLYIGLYLWACIYLFKVNDGNAGRMCLFLSWFSFTIQRRAREVRGPSLFLFTSSNRSQTFSHLLATLHVGWLPRIFNRIVCDNKTVIWWFIVRWHSSNFVADKWWIWTRTINHPRITNEATLPLCASHPETMCQFCLKLTIKTPQRRQWCLWADFTHCSGNSNFDL